MPAARWALYPRHGTTFDRLVPLLMLGVILLALLSQRTAHGGFPSGAPAAERPLATP